MATWSLNNLSNLFYRVVNFCQFSRCVLNFSEMLSTCFFEICNCILFLLRWPERFVEVMQGLWVYLISLLLQINLHWWEMIIHFKKIFLGFQQVKLYFTLVIVISSNFWVKSFAIMLFQYVKFSRIFKFTKNHLLK